MGSSRARRTRLATLALVGITGLAGVTATALLAGCSGTTASGSTSAGTTQGVPSAGSPREAAEAYASAVGSGDPATVPFSAEGSAAAFTALTRGLGDLRPTVTVGSADETDAEAQQAAAQLATQWPIADATGKAWAYRTSLTLVREGDGWRVLFAPASYTPGLRKGERLVVAARPGPRGQILGAGGAVLVTDRPVRRVGLDKTQVPATQAAASATALARAVGVDAAAFATQVKASGPSQFVEAIVLRENDPALKTVLVKLGEIRGATALPDMISLGPTRTFARPLLGSVGQATAEIVAQSKGTVRAGDVVGLSGLQQSRQAQLAGKVGHRISALASGGAARILFESPGEPGQPVRTALSVTHQALAEKLLAPISGPSSAIVAIQPSTGNVLAAASGPGGQGYSTATLGLYPPGSTFKVVSALGMLRAGLTPASPVRCTARITVDGRTFTNHDAYPAARLGTIPLVTAFATSCNTAMIAQAGTVGQERLALAAASLGLTAEPAIGVPAVLGKVPTQTTPVAAAASMIGQGTVQASPLGMATVAASVAAGRTVAPRLVLTPGPEPTSDGATTSESPSGPPLNLGETAALRRLTRAVVTSGSGSLLASLPGHVMAKTGTAECGDANPPLTHAWMIGMKGDLAVAVFVETGAGGARTAGPLLKSYLSGV